MESVGETESAAGDAGGATKRAPISIPSTNSSAHSKSTQHAAIVTIREVIEITYCIAPRLKESK
jgi:hypothetical protein